jgi:uncharacterized metal-binding protein YceD (DUF177 family)
MATPYTVPLDTDTTALRYLSTQQEKAEAIHGDAAIFNIRATRQNDAVTAP